MGYLLFKGPMSSERAVLVLSAFNEGANLPFKED